jgi:hypothetical protein
VYCSSIFRLRNPLFVTRYSLATFVNLVLPVASVSRSFLCGIHELVLQEGQGEEMACHDGIREYASRTADPPIAACPAFGRSRQPRALANTETPSIRHPFQRPSHAKYVSTSRKGKTSLLACMVSTKSSRWNYPMAI